MKTKKIFKEITEGFGYTVSKIPKKTRGEYRTINAPNTKLLEFQRGKLDDLMKVYSSLTKGTEIEHTSHGFIKGRNIVTCASIHYDFKSTIMMDIENFFDMVTKEKVKEATNMNLDDRLFTVDGTCGQGFATSPILANIAIINILKEIKKSLNTMLGDGNFAFTIYADDIQLSTNIEDREVLNQFIHLIQRQFELGGFKIKNSKTRVMYAKGGARRVLGINVWDKHYNADKSRKLSLSRKLNRKVEGYEYALKKFGKKNVNLDVLRGLREFKSLKTPKGV